MIVLVEGATVTKSLCTQREVLQYCPIYIMTKDNLKWKGQHWKFLNNNLINSEL